MTGTEPSKAALEAVSTFGAKPSPPEAEEWNISRNDLARLLDRFAAEARARAIGEAEYALPAGYRFSTFEDSQQMAEHAIEVFRRYIRKLAASPPPASYDDGVRDERARWEAGIDALKRSADPAHHYAADYIRAKARGIVMEHIEAGGAAPQQERPFDKIRAGLEDAIALAKDDTSRGILYRWDGKRMVQVPVEPAAGEPTDDALSWLLGENVAEILAEVLPVADLREAAHRAKHRLDAQAAPPSGWRPIAEAPEGVVLITARVGEKRSTIAARKGDEWFAPDGRTTVTHHSYLPPTHFMPLPAPPAADTQETKDE